jgi:hypothetical protein
MSVKMHINIIRVNYSTPDCASSGCKNGAQASKLACIKQHFTFLLIMSLSP